MTDEDWFDREPMHVAALGGRRSGIIDPFGSRPQPIPRWFSGVTAKGPADQPSVSMAFGKSTLRIDPRKKSSPSRPSIPAAGGKE